MDKVNLREKFDLFSERWSPKIIGELNGQQVKLVKFLGPFVWHHHDKEDELFFVVKGRFRMEFREEEEAQILLFEPATTLNTGNVRNDRTKERLEKI